MMIGAVAAAVLLVALLLRRRRVGTPAASRAWPTSSGSPRYDPAPPNRAERRSSLHRRSRTRLQRSYKLKDGKPPRRYVPRPAGVHFLRSPRTCPIQLPAGTHYAWCGCGQLKIGTPDELDRWWVRHCASVDLSLLQASLDALRGRSPRRQRWAHSTRELSVLAHAALMLREPARWHPRLAIRERLGMVRRVVLLAVDVVPAAVSAPSERTTTRPTLGEDELWGFERILLRRRRRDGRWVWWEPATDRCYPSFAVAGAASITFGAVAGNWSDATKWVGGVRPTAADDVLFTAASASCVVDSATLCVGRSMDDLGYTGTLSGTGTLTIGDGSGGLCRLAAGATYSGTWSTVFVSTSNNGGTGWAVTSAGKAFPGAVSFVGAGGKWVFQDAFTCGALGYTPTGSSANTALDFNGKTVTAISFTSANALTRTLTLGASAVSLSLASAVALDISTTTNLTVTANTATITMSGTGAISNVGAFNMNGASISFTGSGAPGMQGSGHTWANITRTGTVTKSDSFFFSGNVTVTSTFTSTGLDNKTRVLVQSNTIGTPRTITAAALAITNTDFKDIAGAGAASWNFATTPAIGDAGGNSGITFTTAITSVRGGVSLNTGFLRTNGISACYVSVPDSAALSIVNDIDVRARASLPSWSAAGQKDFVTKWGSSGQLSYALTIASGTLSFVISTTGSNALSVSSSTTVGFAADAIAWVRAVRVKTTGVVTFYTSTVTNPTGPSDWTQLGTTQTLSANSAIFDSTALVEVGSQTLGTLGLMTGNFYRAQIRNNVLDDGTGIQFDADFTAQTAGAASFVESSANAATVSITNDEGGNWSGLRWSIASPPLPQDTVIVGAAIQTGTGLTLDSPRLGKDVSFAGYTRTYATGTNAGEMYGSLTLGSGMTITGTGTLTLAGRDTHTITSNGITFTMSAVVSGPGGTYTMQDSFVSSRSVAGGTLTVTNGARLDANNFNVTLSGATSAFVMSTATSSLKMGNGTWTLGDTAVANIWSVLNGSTVTPDNSTIVISTASANTRSFLGGGVTYGTLTYTVAGSTGQLTITGSNSFDTINFSDVTNARTLALTIGTVTTIRSAFNVNGTAGKVMSLVSTSAGTAATLTKTFGTPVFVDYVSVKDSRATGGLWVDGIHYTNVSGNTGWVFADALNTSADTGSGTEANPSVAFSAADTSTGVDAETPAAAALPGVDTGTGAENGSNAAALAAAEVAAGVDAESSAATFTQAEAGAGDEAGDVAAALAAADVGAVVEAEAVAAAAAGDETGTSSESGAAAAALPGADTGAGVEDGALAAALATTETGAGSETETVGAALAGDEAGQSDEAGTVSAAFADTEAGAVLDAGAVAAALAAADMGAGVDEETPAVALLTDDETATGDDLGVVGGSQAVSDDDTGAGVEAGATTATLPGAESSTGTDAETVAAAVPGSDSSVGADAGTLAALAAAAEVAAGVETAATAATLPGSDTGTGGDAGSIGAVLAGADTGTGTEAEAVVVRRDDSDAGVAAEFWSLVATLTGGEHGTGVDDGEAVKSPNVGATFTLELATVEFEPVADGVTFGVDDGGVAFAVVTADVDSILSVAGTTFEIEVE